jgi:hypothetical protein
MLKTTMAWTLMFRVSNRDKAKKEFERTSRLLGRKLHLAKCERYWKIPELWTCDATTIFETPSEAEQIVGYLLLANRLANGWHVLGPNYSGDALESFQGIFDRRHGHAKLTSLEWAHFQMIGTGQLAEDR